MSENTKKPSGSPSFERPSGPPPGRRGPRPGGPMAPGEKPKNLKKSLKAILKYIAGYKIALFIVA